VRDGGRNMRERGWEGRLMVICEGLEVEVEVEIEIELTVVKTSLLPRRTLIR
jgi:hypothetical protein